MDTTSLFFIKETVKHFIAENKIIHEGYKVGFYQTSSSGPYMNAKILLPNDKSFQAESTIGFDDLLLQLKKSYTIFLSQF